MTPNELKAARARLDSSFAKLEAILPDERTIVMAAAAAPLAFLAVHGCSASAYIERLRQLKKMLKEFGDDPS